MGGVQPWRIGSVGSIECVFELPTVGRELEPVSRSAWDADAAHWEELGRLFARRTYSHGGCVAVVEADWLPVARRIRREWQFEQALRARIAASDPDVWKLSRRRSVRVRCRIGLSGMNKLSSYDWYPFFFARALAYDLFLVSNLACPGACNLFSTHLREGKGSDSDTRIGLTSYFFESAAGRPGREWPTARSLALPQVLEWYDAVHPGVGQVASSPVERALFAVLHLADGRVRPESVVWVVHGLEALFSTRPGESAASLFRRLTLLLSPPARSIQSVRRGLNSLYRLRSAFVHGGLPVPHPLQHEVIDRRVVEVTQPIIEATEFGFGLLLAALQVMIEKGWGALEFNEGVRGLPSPAVAASNIQ